jgi:hypothetical protein
VSVSLRSVSKSKKCQPASLRLRRAKVSWEVSVGLRFDVLESESGS